MSSATSASSTTGETPPRTIVSGHASRSIISHMPAATLVPGSRRGWLRRSYRHTQLRSSSWRALCKIPRRSEVRLRVGLCSSVRAIKSSKLAKLCGPLTKSVIDLAFSGVTPGVISIIINRETKSGRWYANANVVRPPSDMPHTNDAVGAYFSMMSAISNASDRGE